MKKMFIKKFRFIGFIATLLIFSGCSKEAGKAVKIALVCPLTGDVAAMGQGMKRATTMAIEEANASGRFKDTVIELAAFDDRADPIEAVNAANQIISDKRIYGVVGHLNSGCSIPASQVYARANLVMMSPASTNPKLTLQGLKNVFRVCTTDDIQGTKAADFVYAKLKKYKVAVIHDKTAYGQGIAESFKSHFAQIGGTVISFDGIDLGDKDFKALLTAIKSKGPELIYFGGMYTECSLITRQDKELGLNVPVFSDDGVFTPEYIKIAGNAAEGDYATMVGVSPEKLPRAKEFTEKYKAKYPGADMQPYDPYTYEATMIILEVVEKTNYDKNKMADYLRSVKYNGILGETRFDANGDTLNKTVGIYRVVNGKFTYVE